MSVRKRGTPQLASTASAVVAPRIVSMQNHKRNLPIQVRGVIAPRQRCDPASHVITACSCVTAASHPCPALEHLARSTRFDGIISNALSPGYPRGV